MTPTAADFLAQPEPEFDPEADRQARELLRMLDGVDNTDVRHAIAVRIIADAHRTGVNRVRSKVIDVLADFGPDRRQVGGLRRARDVTEWRG